MPYRFQVERIFNQNFYQYGEIGSSLCVLIDGEIVIDIWAGHKNKEKTKWSEMPFQLLSSTKAALALCAHMLIERGELGLEKKLLNIGLNMERMEKKIQLLK